MKYNAEILADDEILETLSPEELVSPGESGNISNEDINRMWSEHMHDFVPEDMVNAVVEARTMEGLFEQINHETPTTIKGAFYVLDGSDEKTIDCVIYDPNRNIVYKRKNSSQGIFVFETTVPGEYSIVFSNMRSGIDLTVTLCLHTYEEKEEEKAWKILDDGSRIEVTNGLAASSKVPSSSPSTNSADAQAESMIAPEDMAATDAEVKEVKVFLMQIDKACKQIQSEAKLSLMRQNGHNEDLLQNQDWNFYFVLIEVFAFVSISAYQITHIKKLLENKLII